MRRSSAIPDAPPETEPRSDHHDREPKAASTLNFSTAYTYRHNHAAAIHSISAEPLRVSLEPSRNFSRPGVIRNNPKEPTRTIDHGQALDLRALHQAHGILLQPGRRCACMYMADHYGAHEDLGRRESAPVGPDADFAVRDRTYHAVRPIPGHDGHDPAARLLENPCGTAQRIGGSV